MSVTEKDGKILVKCHAGCPQDRLIAALREKDLWPTGNGKGGTRSKRELLASYEYRDAEGNLLFEVCRFLNADGSKTFSQRRPLPGGGSVWGLRAGEYQCFNNSADWYPVGKKGQNPMAAVKKFPAASLVLYRLSELLAADPAATVYIPEGEKDVERLRDLGMIATCNAMGAGKWREEYNSHLQGRLVVILPDNDDPGRAHAQKVARSVHGIATSIKVVELPDLPEKGDVSDWLDSGGTVEQLQALVEETPEWSPATASGPGGDSRKKTEARKSKGKNGGDGEGDQTQAEILLNLTAEVELFHNPNMEGFASFPVENLLVVGRHHETWPIKSTGFRRWLAREFYEAEGKPPNSEAMGGALNILEAKAHFDGPERDVYVRVAGDFGNTVYLDLGNPLWEAVAITPSEWQIVSAPPVKFRRSKGMAGLYRPERGGNIRELRPFLNVGSDADFYLIVAWLLAALNPSGPYPILVLQGEQGAAKSTAGRVVRSLVDPGTSPLRSTPREIRDIMISATNSWVLAFDNLSGLPAWLSDVFYRLSTGGGFSTRALWTNGEEAIFDAMRPLILNGISAIATRPDLADRSIIITLPQIAKEARRKEQEFWRAFEAVQPRIIGALLDAVSAGLRHINQVNLESYPRMADFCAWITACEPAMPWPQGSFMKAYESNRQEAVEATLEADVVAVAVREFMEDKETWAGSASKLLEELSEIAGEKVTKGKIWPKAANSLSNRLTRAATFLRAVGIDVLRSKSGNRLISLTRNGKENTAQTAQTAQTEEPCGFSPDDPLDDPKDSDDPTVQKDDPRTVTDDPQKRPSTRKSTNGEALDDMDDRGDKKQTFSGNDENDSSSLYEVEL
ncbi:MAG: hypothetical protein FJ135_16720 [Deltaproteobacteria bacterium]|nr:hypothetical protein [Deltaproteobacteria bacterium]